MVSEALSAPRSPSLDYLGLYETQQRPFFDAMANLPGEAANLSGKAHTCLVSFFEGRGAECRKTYKKGDKLLQGSARLTLLEPAFCLIYSSPLQK